MTEEEWERSESPGWMFETLRRYSRLPLKARSRKYRLTAVANCRAFPPTASELQVLSILLLTEAAADDPTKFYSVVQAVATSQYRSSRDPDDETPDWHGIVTALADPDSFASAKRMCGEMDWEMLWSDIPKPSQYRSVQAGVIRDIFGNPFRPVTLAPDWRTEAAVGIASQMYDSRDFGNMPILADALQDAGCEVPEILNHCREPGTHVRGCWVVDLVLGKS